MSRVIFDIPTDIKIGESKKTGRRVHVYASQPNVATNIVEKNSDMREYTQPVFEFDGRYYPQYLNFGNAIKYILPIAENFCRGDGVIAGLAAENFHFDGAKILNIADSESSAFNLSGKNFDFIFSAHFLNRIKKYDDLLLYWHDSLRPGGQLFLYLPHPDAALWLPEHMPEHYHYFRPERLASLLKKIGFVQIFYSNRDLFWSFALTAAKPQLENGLTI